MRIKIETDWPRPTEDDGTLIWLDVDMSDIAEKVDPRVDTKAIDRIAEAVAREVDVMGVDHLTVGAEMPDGFVIDITKDFGTYWMANIADHDYLVYEGDNGMFYENDLPPWMEDSQHYGDFRCVQEGIAEDMNECAGRSEADCYGAPARL